MIEVITFLTAFELSFILIAALALDALIGEVKRFHPLGGFGYVAIKLEGFLNKPALPAQMQKVLGLWAWLVMVIPLPLALYCLLPYLALPWQWFIEIIGLYFAIGLCSLKQHGMQVFIPLMQNDLAKARHYTGYLVSRETASLTPDEMARATTESMLENGHDAVIASFVCFVVGGLPLVILHRLANTLDAMWGYKNPRYVYFGWAAARADDLLGFVSAKLCTLLYALQGLFRARFFLAMKNAYRQGNQYKSHNGGWVMAAGATVLNIKLGGAAVYHGQSVKSVILGACSEARTVDAIAIKSSLILVVRSCLLMLTSIIFIEGGLWL